MKTLLLPMALLAIVLSCKTSSDSASKARIGFTTGEMEPELGFGFNSLTQELIPSNKCFVGEETSTISNSTKIDFSNQTSKEDILKSFTIELKGTPRLSFVDMNLEQGIFTGLKSSSLQENISYEATVNVAGKKLINANLSDSVPTKTAVEVMRRCGDEYVSQINMGGRIIVSLDFIFASVEDRKKWQSMGLLNISLANLSKDLIRKGENKNLKGQLNLKIYQEGGDTSKISQGLTTCYMSDKESLSICTDKMTKVIEYAQNDFQKEVKSAPAILSYHTNTVKYMDISGKFPPLPSKVESIRSQLLVKKSVEEAKLVNLQSAKKFNLQGVVAKLTQVEQNVALINKAALDCYRYTYDNQEKLNWSNCYNGFNSISSNIAKSDADINQVHSSRVRADDPVGLLITNTYDKPMKLSMAVDTESRWAEYVGGKDHYKNYRGETMNGYRTSCTGDCSVKGGVQGALYVNHNGAKSPAQQTEVFELYPGESLEYSMNDIYANYPNNIGTIGVYWTCLNCDKSFKKRPVITKTVDARKDAATVFSNPDSIAHTYSIYTYGAWSNGGWGWPSWFGAEGADKPCNKCVRPEAKLGELLVYKRGPKYVDFEDMSSVRLSPGERLYFKMNDISGGYKDNSGNIKVQIVCSDCEK